MTVCNATITFEEVTGAGNTTAIENDAWNITATISSWPENVRLGDGEVSFGFIPAGDSAWSQDTFSIQVDMSNQQGS